jgi:uncharacterized protein DUF2612
MKDVEQTIISQYGNSAAISALIYGMNTNIDPAADIDNFYNAIFNVSTANLFGLSIWSRIVGIPQSLIVSLGTYLDDVDTFRSLIMLKALSNIAYDSAPSINQLLQNWIGGTNPRAYVQDTGNMTMVYNFEFPLSTEQTQILLNSGIFLRGAGVLTAVQAQEYPVIGFAEMGLPWVTTMGFGVFGDVNAIN